MANHRKIGIVTLWWLASMPLSGGTGRPSDGLLSFLLLLGFLGLVYGVFSLIDFIKRRIWKFLEEIGEAML